MAKAEDILGMELEMDKRKASPNALDADDTPDPKRIQVTEPKSSNDGSSNPNGFSVDTTPHLTQNCTVIEFFFVEEYTNILAQRVLDHTQLKSMIFDLKDSLLKVRDDGNGLQDFARKVNDLFNLQEFIKACAETFFEADCWNLAIDMNSYKNEKKPMERWGMLQPDISFLTSVLKAKYCLLVSRGVLSVLFGYWCNDALCKKVRQGIYALKEETYRLPLLYKLPIFDSFSASVEGLKDALRSRFPSDEAMMMCEQVEDILPMDHDMSKRRTSLDALDAEDDPDPNNISFTTPHLTQNCTVMEFFFEEMYTSVLAQKVIDHIQLEAMIYGLKDSLLKVCDDGDGLQDFVCKVNDLFNLQDFIQACVDTYFTDYCSDMVVDMDSYKNEKLPIERWESLQPDISFLKGVLKAKYCLLVTRGVLSVLFGYWDTDAFCTKVRVAIRDERMKTYESPPGCWHEQVDGISYDASVEGLKEAVRYKFLPAKAEMMCEQIDREKEYYQNQRFLKCEGRKITWFMVVWSGDSFSVSSFNFSD